MITQIMNEDRISEHLFYELLTGSDKTIHVMYSNNNKTCLAFNDFIKMFDNNNITQPKIEKMTWTIRCGITNNVIKFTRLDNSHVIGHRPTSIIGETHAATIYAPNEWDRIVDEFKGYPKPITSNLDRINELEKENKTLKESNSLMITLLRDIRNSDKTLMCPDLCGILLDITNKVKNSKLND